MLGAAYPEPHPDSRGWAEDLAHLRAKLDAGVRVLVTQLFFDNDDYRRFIDRLRAAASTCRCCRGSSRSPASARSSG